MIRIPPPPNHIIRRVVSGPGTGTMAAIEVKPPTTMPVPSFNRRQAGK